MLSNDLGSLFRLLDSLDQEVTGRQNENSSPEFEAQLRRLLKGEALGKEEKAALFEQLKSNPAWSSWLADQVKERRKPKAEL